MTRGQPARQFYDKGVIKRMFDVRPPTRDDLKLFSDIWLPTSEGRHPVNLIRRTCS